MLANISDNDYTFGAVQKASKIVIDGPKQFGIPVTLGEMVKAGLLKPEETLRIGAVINGNAPGRENDEEVIFFSALGMGIHDLDDRVHGLSEGQVHGHRHQAYTLEGSLLVLILHHNEYRGGGIAKAGEPPPVTCMVMDEEAQRRSTCQTTYLYEVRGPKTLIEMTWEEVAEALEKTDICLINVGAIEETRPPLAACHRYLRRYGNPQTCTEHAGQRGAHGGRRSHGRVWHQSRAP